MRETVPALPDLLPPPRRVSPGARVRLLANVLTLAGGVVAGVAAGIFTLSVLAADFPGRLALARGAVEAQGRLVKTEPTRTRINETLLYRHFFTYRTPDGVEHAGHSYSVGPRFEVRPGGKAVPVTVEYVPGRPGVARIKGMDTGAGPLFLPPCAGLATLLGLAMLGGGLANGRNQARLLAVGVPAPAEIVACVLPNPTGPDRTRLTWDEYCARAAAPAPAAFGPFPAVNPAGVVRAFQVIWTAMLVGILGMGTLLMGTMLVLLLAGRMAPFVMNGRLMPPAQAAGILAVSLVVWLTFGLVLFRVGRAGMGRFADPAGGGPPASVNCTYSFTPSGAAGPVAGSASVTVDPDAGPRRVALYDPDRPERSTLVESLPPGVRVSEFGDWEADADPGPWLRAAVCAVLPVAGPLLGWAAWQFIPA